MADKIKYQTITKDAQILYSEPIVQDIENQINKICKNSFYMYDKDIFSAVQDLFDLKKSYINKYCDFVNILQFFNINDRKIIIEYFSTMKSAIDIANDLGISIRTFFRRLNIINDKYIKLKNKLEELRNEESGRNNSNDRTAI